MSISDPNKATKTQNESADSDAIKQENPCYAIDMDLVEKEPVSPGAITLAKSKDYMCIDIVENSTEPLPAADRIEEIESGHIINITELRVHIIGQKTARRKFTLKGIYDNMVRLGKPPQTLGQEQPAPQLQQTLRTQYSPTESQGPLQAQGYPQDPKSRFSPGQRQGYSQQQGYPQKQGSPQQQVFQQQGYPQQQHGYPQQQQQHGYPQQQGSPQTQGYPTQGGVGGYPAIPMIGPPLQYDPQTRNSFVRLVMFLVLIMLMSTALFVAIVYTNPNLRLFFLKAGWMIMVPAMVLLIAAQCSMMCSACGRVPPGNFVCLILGVSAMTIITARITVFYRTELIMYALVATTAVVAVCIALSFSKFDFTSYMLYIVGIATAFSVIVMIIVIVTMVSGTMMKPLFMGILIVGTIIQVAVLTMELQMVLGGGAVELSEADYAIAAFMIYTSIIDIFLKMLQLMGLFDS